MSVQKLFPENGPGRSTIRDDVVSELGSGVLEGHILPWGMVRTIGGACESVVGVVNLSGIVECLGFCARLATNGGRCDL